MQATTEQYTKALKRAHDEGIQIVGSTQVDSGDVVWHVTSASEPGGWYTVRASHAGRTLACNCRARGLCKHEALVQEAMESAATATAARQRQPQARQANRSHATPPLTDLATFSIWR